MTLSNLDKTELYAFTQFYYFEIEDSHTVIFGSQIIQYNSPIA
jgi:hypothetical protein